LAPTEDDAGRLTRLEQRLEQLTSRLAAIEQPGGQTPPGGPSGPAGTGQPAGPGGPGPAGDDESEFGYSGRGWFGRDRLTVRRRAGWAEVMGLQPEPLARVFAALASPARITVLRALLDGPRTSQQLRQDLDGPSAGQLYHHLKELLAAGLIFQPGRSMYALPQGSQVALCVQLLAATHLTPAAQPSPELPDEDRP